MNGTYTSSPPPILYQDADYVAINKPAGLLVHRTGLASDASEFALQWLSGHLGQKVFPCHRLDRPTSGVLLFALHLDALRAMEEQFRGQTVRKSYLAVVRGWTEGSGQIDSPLRSEENPDKVQDACTRYERLARSELMEPVGRYSSARFSLLELKPQTGRKHQLRRHMAHIRHPILGDTRHGDGTQNRFARARLACPRLLLHAGELTFSHPKGGQSVQIHAPLPDAFAQVLDALGWGIHKTA
ncbi:pseudouridine synthase [Coraliomargarita parva]|uniref:pseudouridine synthase n=1 Tax=Coraliomargarita parva TaxID=3014050 RepID=UPI0022B54AFB|nr:pseudouridine synthase [Coraliomargarita parva]